MTGNFNPEPAAEFLAKIWRGPEQIAELPPAMRPADIDQGYDIQDRLVKRHSKRLQAHSAGGFRCPPLTE